VDGLTIARQRIAQEATEKSGYLDLGCLGLSALPDELFELKQLSVLNLGVHYFDEEGHWKQNASNIEPNSVAGSLIRLVCLPDLRRLSLSGTELSDLAPLKDLTKLQELDCSATQVSDLILSDKYLKSPFCMFELFEIWRNSRQNEVEFLKRCRVYTLGDAQIWNLLGRLKYAKHWKAQYDEVANAVKEVGPVVLGESDYAQFKLMQDFVNHIGDVLAAFAKIVQPRSFEDLVKYGFEDPR
jgi:Leucine Rich Repeat (LRR) protein